MFMEILGTPPESLLDKGSRTTKFFDGYAPKTKPNSKGKLRTPDTKSLSKKLKNCEEYTFLKFI